MQYNADHILSHGTGKSKASTFIHNTVTNNEVCKFHNVASTTTTTTTSPTTTIKAKTLTHLTSTIHFVGFDKKKTTLKG